MESYFDIICVLTTGLFIQVGQTLVGRPIICISLLHHCDCDGKKLP